MHMHIAETGQYETIGKNKCTVHRNSNGAGCVKTERTVRHHSVLTGDRSILINSGVLKDHLHLQILPFHVFLCPTIQKMPVRSGQDGVLSEMENAIPYHLWIPSCHRPDGRVFLHVERSHSPASRPLLSAFLPFANLPERFPVLRCFRVETYDSIYYIIYE